MGECLSVYVSAGGALTRRFEPMIELFKYTFKTSKRSYFICVCYNDTTDKYECAQIVDINGRSLLINELLNRERWSAQRFEAMCNRKGHALCEQGYAQLLKRLDSKGVG